MAKARSASDAIDRCRHFAAWTSAACLLSPLGLAALHAQQPSNAPNILPAPARSVAIGRVTYHWVDTSRAETFSKDAGARREVVVDVWYPAKRVAGRAAASYLPDLLGLRRVFSDSGMRRRFAPAYEAMEAGRLQTHATEGAAAQCPPPGCPLLIFSHGGGVDRSFYTAQYEDFAAHGYVVAAIAHPYLTHAVVFPGGRVVRLAPRLRDTTPPSIPVWRRQIAEERARSDRTSEIAAADIRFVIDELTRYARDPSLGAPFVRQLDLQRIGALGHSMGGKAAARACQTDRRIKACLNQDGTSSALPVARDANGRTMEQPFMYFGRVQAPPTPWSDSVLAVMQMSRAEEDSLIRIRPLQQDSVLADIPAGAWRVRLKTPGANHMSFSDEPLIKAAGDSVKTAEALLSLSMVHRYTRAFFDKTLLGRRGTVLDRPPAQDSALVSVERFGRGASRRD
jgi:predicted dienelactone hydrolase